MLMNALKTFLGAHSCVLTVKAVTSAVAGVVTTYMMMVCLVSVNA